MEFGESSRPKRKRKSAKSSSAKVLQFFSEVETGYVRCSLCAGKNVRCTLAAGHAGNLKRHLFQKHPDEALQTGLNPPKPPSASEINNAAQDKMNTYLYLKYVMKMVTVGSMSFRSLDAPGLCDIIEFLNSMFGVDVTSRNVQKLVTAGGAAMRQRITSELKGRMVCYKIDAATCQGRSLLGTTAQFAEGGKIHIRVLGCIEANDSHTADMLARETKHLMEQFGKDIDDAYAVTVDNAANMKRTVLNLAHEQALDYDDFGFDALLKPLRKKINETKAKQDEPDNEPDNESDDESDADLAAEEDLFNRVSESNILSLQPCGAHTLNLCITDAMKPYGENLTRIRNFLKKAKLSRYQKLYETHKVPKPDMDNVTRWSGTHRMLKPVLKNKEFYSLISDALPKPERKFQLTQEDWDFIEKFVEAFEPASVCIDRIQAEQLTVGDFLWAWSEMKLELEDVILNNDMANELLDAINRRESKLKESDAVLAAIYFDPRYNFNGSSYLNEDDKRRAQEHILKVHLMLQRLKSNDSNKNHSSTSSSAPDPQYSRMDQLFTQNYGPPKHDPNDMPKKINLIQYQDRVLFQTDTTQKQVMSTPLEYWRAKKLEEPQLYELAHTILALPCCQVSVERLFSGLKLILTYLRKRIGKDILDDIMILKGNAKLIDELKIDFSQIYDESD